MANVLRAYAFGINSVVRLKPVNAIQQLTEMNLFHNGAEWAQPRRPQIEVRVTSRLAARAANLGERDYLVGRFSVVDLLMVTVLHNLRHADLVAQHPTIKAYRERCEARPAFQKALRDQLADFVEQLPAA